MKKAPRNPVLLIVSSIFLVSALIFVIVTYFIQKPATVFEVNQSESVVEGVIFKDAAIGIEGNYLLIKNDGSAILLDIQGLDSFVGQEVVLSGVVLPASPTGQPPTMTVKSINFK